MKSDDLLLGFFVALPVTVGLIALAIWWWMR